MKNTMGYDGGLQVLRVNACRDSELAAVLIRQAAYRELVEPGNLILHSDNGGPMKGATMLAPLQRLGFVPSFSRPASQMITRSPKRSKPLSSPACGEIAADG